MEIKYRDETKFGVLFPIECIKLDVHVRDLWVKFIKGFCVCNLLKVQEIQIFWEVCNLVTFIKIWCMEYFMGRGGRVMEEVEYFTITKDIYKIN